jgi:hypothetical protein
VQSVASILDRFRRAAGVPAAAAEDLPAELAPVFGALEHVEAEARAVLEAAEREASQAIAAAEAHGAEIRAAWRDRAQAEYARAESERRSAAAARAEIVEAEAREQARQIRRQGEERLEAMVAEVIDCVRAAAR